MFGLFKKKKMWEQIVEVKENDNFEEKSKEMFDYANQKIRKLSKNNMICFENVIMSEMIPILASQGMMFEPLTFTHQVFVYSLPTGNTLVMGKYIERETEKTYTIIKKISRAFTKQDLKEIAEDWDKAFRQGGSDEDQMKIINNEYDLELVIGAVDLTTRKLVFV